MAAVEPPIIDDLPAAPQRLVDAPTVYVPKADAFADAQVAMVAQFNATAAATYQNALAAEAGAASAETSATAAGISANVAMAATDYMRRSTANLTIGAGAKAVTGLNVPGAAAFANDDEVSLIYAEDAEIRQWGLASAVNAGAGTMTVTVAAGDHSDAAGPFDNWIVVHRAFENLVAANLASVRAGLSNILGVTPKMLRESPAPVAIAYAATITADREDGMVRMVTLTGNALFDIPDNIVDGDYIKFIIKQDATGTRLGTWAAGWTFDGGTQALSTAANAVDIVTGYVESAAGPIIRGTFKKAFAA